MLNLRFHKKTIGLDFRLRPFLFRMNYAEKIDKNPVFETIRQAATGMEVYIVGGFVRDLVLKRPSKDIDVVCVGNGIDLAKKTAKLLGRDVPMTVFKNFGTAQVKYKGLEIEFVGAGKNRTATIRASPLWKTGRCRTTKTAAISPSMPWPSALTSRTLAS